MAVDNDHMQPLTVRELAKSAGVSEQYIRRVLAAGEIPGAYKLGHIWAIPKDEAKRWIEKRQR